MFKWCDRLSNTKKKGKLLYSPGLQGHQADLVVPANEKKTDH